MGFFYVKYWVISLSSVSLNSINSFSTNFIFFFEMFLNYCKFFCCGSSCRDNNTNSLKSITFIQMHSLILNAIMKILNQFFVKRAFEGSRRFDGILNIRKSSRCSIYLYSYNVFYALVQTLVCNSLLTGCQVQSFMVV